MNTNSTNISYKKNKNKSKTYEKRKSYNYRAEYFKRNPGLFGILWFCSQCGKPLLTKHNVCIDHIIPLNKGGSNHHLNCTAICKRCNSSKSDKIDKRIFKGFIFKAFETVLMLGQREFNFIFKYILNLIKKAIKSLK